MRDSSSIGGPSIVLVVIATLMLQLAFYDRQGGLTEACIQLAIAIALAAAIYAITCHKRSSGGRWPIGMCFLALIALPFAWNAIERFTVYSGQPFEMQMAFTLQNMMLGLIAQRNDKRGKMFASLASCFLALYSIIWLLNPWTGALLFLYTVVGMWWLMGAYWDRLSGCFLSSSERYIPWKPVGAAALLGCTGLLLGLPFATGGNFTTAIQGFLPSSGGTRWQDAFAYGGVGDGPQMVSAKDNASGFGPIESELFLESKMPSLYDTFNEFSNAAPKPKKRQRAIPLAPSQMQVNHIKRGENQKAGREFSAVRRRKQETRNVKDLRSHALMQVAGRVPLHLGLCTYDTWNGHSLSSSNSAPPITLYLDTSSEEGKNWVRYSDSQAGEWLTHPERHELRILNLKTRSIPAPPNMVGVHIDKLHTEKLFETTQDGMLALSLDFIPQLTVMHVESLRRRAITEPNLFESIATDDLFNKTAREWTKGVPHGWPQVQAICDHLRSEYSLDPNAMVPEGKQDAAAYFLFESKRGPDYLFATSSALLIRSLGYEARVVSGFYADPKHYDRQSRLTSVYADDAHFWVEVLSSNDETSGTNATQFNWVAAEPTPGYEILLAPETFWSMLLSRASLTWKAIKRNPIPLLASLAIGTIVWIKRAAIGDFLITGWWEMHHRWGDMRHEVISTLRLLDRRARVRGYSRAKGAPLSRWELGDSDSWAVRFRELANWALYGEGIPLAQTPQEVKSLCREASALAYRSQRSSNAKPTDRGTA